MVLVAHALLADNPAPTREEIVEAISGNICRCTGYAQIVEAIALAAERMRGANRPSELAQMTARPAISAFVSTDRRVREDRRFVAGKGRFVADITLPNTKHVALVTCPHAAARIKRIDKSRGAENAGRALCAGRRGTGGGDAADDDRARPSERAAPASGARSRALFRRMGRRGGRRHARAGRGRGRGSRDRLRAAALRARRRTGAGRRRAGARGARLQRAARQDLHLGRGRQGFQGQPAPTCRCG